MFVRVTSVTSSAMDSLFRQKICVWASKLDLGSEVLIGRLAIHVNYIPILAIVAIQKLYSFPPRHEPAFSNRKEGKRIKCAFLRA